MVGFNDGKMRKGDRNQRWHPLFFLSLPRSSNRLHSCFLSFLYRRLRREDAKRFIMKAFSRRSAATKVTVNPVWGITAGVLLLPSSVLSGCHGASSIEGPLVVHTGWFVWRLLAFRHSSFSEKLSDNVDSAREAAAVAAVGFGPRQTVGIKLYYEPRWPGWKRPKQVCLQLPLSSQWNINNNKTKKRPKKCCTICRL